MRNLLGAVIDHLNRHGIVFFGHGERSLLVPIPTPRTLLLTQILVSGDGELLSVYSLCPHRVPIDKRQGAAEVITRANYGLPVGNFEMDYEDGEIRFKVSIPVAPDQELTDELLRWAIGLNVTTHDRYLPAIEGVLFQDEQPSDAVARVERVCREAPRPQEIDRVVKRLLSDDGEKDAGL